MARQKLGEGETMRLHLKISPAEVEEIDDWRFSNRADNRSDAIRRLCGIGVEFSKHREKTAEIAARVLDHLSTPEEEVDRAAMRKDVGDFFNHVGIVVLGSSARFYRDDAFEELAEKAAQAKEDDA